MVRRRRRHVIKMKKDTINLIEEKVRAAVESKEEKRREKREGEMMLV